MKASNLRRPTASGEPCFTCSRMEMCAQSLLDCPMLGRHQMRLKRLYSSLEPSVGVEKERVMSLSSLIRAKSSTGCVDRCVSSGREAFSMDWKDLKDVKSMEFIGGDQPGEAWAAGGESTVARGRRRHLTRTLRFRMLGGSPKTGHNK